MEIITAQSSLGGLSAEEQNIHRVCLEPGKPSTSEEADANAHTCLLASPHVGGFWMCQTQMQTLEAFPAHSIELTAEGRGSLDCRRHSPFCAFLLFFLLSLGEIWS